MADRAFLHDLDDIPAVDQHAHNLVRPDLVTAETFQAAFTEGYAPEVVSTQVRDTLLFRRSLRDLASFHGCEPDLAAILAAREQTSFEDLAFRYLQASNVQALLLDDGFMADQILPVAWHQRLTRSYRLLRVERLAEELIAQCPTWPQFAEQLRLALDDLPPEVVGLKSIVAYRTGLAVEPPDEEAAAACFEELRESVLSQSDREPQPLPRIACRPLNDWVVWRTLEAATERGLPVQFHTGFGDPDLDLRLASPLHLRPLLEEPALRGVPIVLLHGSYPYTREAAYLAAMYPNVYVDFGLAVPSLSVAGMRGVVRALLELAPLGKVLFATDAHVLPELFYLGTLWGRRVLSAELEGATQDGDLTGPEALDAAEMILRRNANTLYGLPR